MARTRSSALVLGVLLVAVGGILIVERYVDMSSAPLWLLGLGAAFSLAAILGSSYPSLVAGMILLGVGAGKVLERHGFDGVPRSSWMPLCLAAGFLGIWALGALLGLRKHWWPLVPAVVLVVYGGAGLVGRLPEEIAEAALNWWPLILVGAGLWIVIRAFRK